MTLPDLEAVIWRHWPTRGTEAQRAVSAIVGAADAYTTARMRKAAQQRRARHRPYHSRRRIALYHTSDTDLHELIGVLAAALLGDSSSEREAA